MRAATSRSAARMDSYADRAARSARRPPAVREEAIHHRERWVELASRGARSDAIRCGHPRGSAGGARGSSPTGCRLAIRSHMSTSPRIPYFLEIRAHLVVDLPAHERRRRRREPARVPKDRVQHDGILEEVEPLDLGRRLEAPELRAPSASMNVASVKTAAASGCASRNDLARDELRLVDVVRVVDGHELAARPLDPRVDVRELADVPGLTSARGRVVPRATSAAIAAEPSVDASSMTITSSDRCVWATIDSRLSRRYASPSKTGTTTETRPSAVHGTRPYHRAANDTSHGRGARQRRSRSSAGMSAASTNSKARVVGSTRWSRRAHNGGRAPRPPCSGTPAARRPLRSPPPRSSRERAAAVEASLSTWTRRCGTSF